MKVMLATKAYFGSLTYSNVKVPLAELFNVNSNLDFVKKICPDFHNGGKLVCKVDYKK